ncbi:hypothetical protein BDN72DRAFT_895964 [Pluteus cervinus]|uniref:Uncharacterized protein n=1 Tax=Pluteus cervinus TaxID=181527 RepID=A0ACD3B096_9AGAR|nr:hypothetical protein BDN72DRAFT_895964 [Pluteus cervinus]
MTEFATLNTCGDRIDLGIQDESAASHLHYSESAMIRMPDLPIELWLDILSYLPPGSTRKLLGVNRTFFELAMNEIYQRISFTEDNDEIQKTFDQLRNPTIAKRVRRLYLSPHIHVVPAYQRQLPSPGFISSFIKGLDEEIRNWLPFPETPLATTARDRGISLPWISPLTKPSHNFLLQATEALSACSELRELCIFPRSIALEDGPIPPPFGTLLSNIWGTHATRLKRFDLFVTPAEIPFIVNSFDVHPLSGIETSSNVNQRLCIQEFNLVLVNGSTAPHLHLQPIIRLLNYFTNTLRSLCIAFTLCELVDLAPFFRDLSQTNGRVDAGPRFPLLSYFMFHFDVRPGAPPIDPSHLLIFSRQHQSTLRSISITYYAPGVVSAGWSPFSENPNWFLKSLLDHQLPVLEKLELEESNYDRPIRGVAEETHLKKLFSSTPSADGLKEAVLTGLTMALPKKLAILEDLVNGGGSGDTYSVGITLRKLKLGLDILQPEILDFIMQKFTTLERLDLEYREVAGVSGDPSADLSRPLFRLPSSEAFIADLRKRVYSHSNLKIVRCALFGGTRRDCVCSRPQGDIARAVQEAFTVMPGVDLYDNGPCRPGCTSHT